MVAPGGGLVSSRAVKRHQASRTLSNADSGQWRRETCPLCLSWCMQWCPINVPGPPPPRGQGSCLLCSCASSGWPEGVALGVVAVGLPCSELRVGIATEPLAGSPFRQASRPPWVSASHLHARGSCLPRSCQALLLWSVGTKRKASLCPREAGLLGARNRTIGADAGHGVRPFIAGKGDLGF